MLLNLAFVLINVFFVLIGYITRDKKALVKFTDFNTIIIGDTIGLSLINYSFITNFDFRNINIIFVLSGSVVAFFVTYLLHQSYKFDTQKVSNSGYIHGDITPHGRLHLAYCFYQIVIISLLVLTLVDLKRLDVIFLLGGLIYILSVFLDIKKGILFRKNK